MFTCEICSKEFKSIRSLAIHKNWHNPHYREVKSRQVSEKNKLLWLDDDYRQKNTIRLRDLHKEVINFSEYRELKSKEMSSRLTKLWSDDAYRSKMTSLAKKIFGSKEYREFQAKRCLDDFNKIYKVYLGRHGISPESKSYVYLVKFLDKIKVGFTCRLEKRFSDLNPLELIELIPFNNVFEGLKYEYEFHQEHKNSMISNEYYPLKYLDEFMLKFINYKRRCNVSI